jgi:ribonuclease E
MAASSVEPLPRGDGEERRGRTRDRYGRDRRERAPRDGEELDNGAAAPVEVNLEAVETEAPAALAPVAAPAEATPAPAARPERAPRPVSAPAGAEKAPTRSGRGALPKVQPFELPLADLAQVAEGSGLHWVNSDAERVAQVRAAIAAEPKAIRVPRERPPAIVIDEGPLVLVETRRNLAATTLPFEREAGDNR